MSDAGRCQRRYVQEDERCSIAVDVTYRMGEARDTAQVGYVDGPIGPVAEDVHIMLAIQGGEGKDRRLELSGDEFRILVRAVQRALPGAPRGRLPMPPFERL